MKCHLLLIVSTATAAILCAPTTAGACTTFMAEHAGKPVVGKSYDWTQSAGLVTVNPRGLQKVALTLDAGDTPAAWTSKYGSVTFNQYGVELPNAGINEKGLVIELMWLEKSEYPAADGRPVVNELQWIGRALDLHASVAELVADAPGLRVSPVYAKVHYLACDATGDCAAFEYLGGQLVITTGKDMPAKTLANGTYASSAEYLAQFTGFGGSKAMPTSTSSLDRFTRASMLAQDKAGTVVPDSAFGILDSVAQSSTVWSMAYSPIDRTVYFRTQVMPKIKSIRLDALSFRCGTRKTLDIDFDGSGDVVAALVDYTQAANRALLGRSMAGMQFPAVVLELLAVYPDTCICAPEPAGFDGGVADTARGTTQDAASASPADSESAEDPATDAAAPQPGTEDKGSGCSCALTRRPGGLPWAAVATALGALLCGWGRRIRSTLNRRTRASRE